MLSVDIYYCPSKATALNKGGNIIESPFRVSSTTLFHGTTVVVSSNVAGLIHLLYLKGDLMNDISIEMI